MPSSDPRDPSWYWDEFDAALRPRAGALAVVMATLMAVCTLPGVAGTPPPAAPVAPAATATPALAHATLPPCHIPDRPQENNR